MLAAVAAVVVLMAAAAAAQSPADVCPGQPNTLPVWDQAPELVASVPNGKLFVMGPPDQLPRPLVLHVYGTPYEMGLAHGQLLSAQAAAVFYDMESYLVNQVEQALPNMQPWLAELVAEVGILAALEATYLLQAPYLPDYYVQEVQGLADGAGIQFEMAMRFQLFPSLIQAACSMIGATGASIADTGGSLYQLRALDWGTSSPLNAYAAVIVHHPAEGTGAAYATLGWAGWVGAMTGYSENSVAVCEKLWYSYTGFKDRAGYPWHLRLRDILQFDATAAEGVQRLFQGNRTCSIFVGVGDNSPSFSAVAYSYDNVTVFDDSNFFQPHVNFKDVVYIDPHAQPSQNPCFPAAINASYGSLDAEHIFRQITPLAQTGDLHLAVFDHAARQMYFSVAGPAGPGPNYTAGEPAYNRAFYQLDMDSLFAEPSP